MCVNFEIHGGYRLRIHMILLAFILFAGSTVGQNIIKEATQNNSSATHSPDLSSPATSDSASFRTAYTEKTAEIQGIWSFNLKGTELVTVVLHQNGEELFGSGKSESSGWNSALQGTISGIRLSLAMMTLKNNSLNSIRLVGTLQNNSISGNFVQSDDLGNAESGLFKAVLINRDLSSYSLAKSARPAIISVNSSSPISVSAPSSAITSDPAGKLLPKQLSDPKYVDVHSMSGYISESLGVGFVGDGTMGAGGSSMG
jgi:hypothetical protein